MLDATLDGAPLAPRPEAEPTHVRAFVLGRGSLVVRFVAGPPTRALAALVGVVDERQREIMLLGPDRDALVLRYRRRAAAWRLDEPDLRFEGAARTWASGDTLAIAVERTSRGACLAAGGTPACLTSATPGRAWSLVLYPESFPAWSRTALDLLWLGGLALLLGWCAGTVGPAVAAKLVAVATLLAIPPLFGGVPATPAELVGAAGGLVTGVWLRHAARRRG